MIVQLRWNDNSTYEIYAPGLHLVLHYCGEVAKSVSSTRNTGTIIQKSQE